MFKFVMKRWFVRHWRWFPLFAVSFIGGWQLWKAFLMNWVYRIGTSADPNHLGEVNHHAVTGAIVSVLFATSTSMVMAIRVQGTGTKKSPDRRTHSSWVMAYMIMAVGVFWWMEPSFKETASEGSWFIALALGLIVSALSASRIKTAKLVGRGIGLASVMMVGWQAMQWFRDGMTGYAVFAIVCALQWVISLRLLEGPMGYIRSILRRAMMHTDELRKRSIAVDQANLNRRRRQLRVKGFVLRIIDEHDDGDVVNEETSLEVARMHW